MTTLHAHTPSFQLYKRLLRMYVGRYTHALIIGGICMLLVAASTASLAYLTKHVLDDIFIEKNTQMLSWIPLVIITVSIINAVSDYGQSVALKYVGQRVVSDMQGDLFAHLIRADISLFHDQASGRLISRLTNDILLIRYSVSQVLTAAIKEAFTMVFLVGVMFTQSISMSLLMTVIVVFGLLPLGRLGRRMRRVADQVQTRMGDFSAQLDDTFHGVRVVKAYHREEFEIERTRGITRQLFKLYYRAARIQSFASPLMGMMGGIAVGALIWYAGAQVIDGRMTTGAFFSFLTASMLAYRPVRVLGGINTQLQEGMAAAARFFDVMDTHPTILDAPDAKPIVVTKGEVVFDHVTFHYHEGSGGVKDLSFTVPSGKTVALVGSSGSGKTTIMNLLLRFYDVQAGHITIDGQSLRGVTLASLRNALGFVSQDIVLFNDSVRANIAYGRLDASEEEIVNAAKKAHAHEFIVNLPQGYDTQIGPHGVKLSGGQRQRLSIARAILKDAPILLLDEATSALDNTSERIVQEALNELMKDRTTLVIAHRLTTIQDADIILVLDHGRIIAQGTHQQLLAQCAAYRTMHQTYQQAG